MYLFMENSENHDILYGYHYEACSHEKLPHTRSVLRLCLHCRPRPYYAFFQEISELISRL